MAQIAMASTTERVHTLRRLNNELREFGARIEDVNEQRREIAQGAFEVIWKVGEQLRLQQDETPHGQWEQWCRDNLDYDSRQAGRYLRVERNRERLAPMIGDSVTSIKEAEAVLADHGSRQPSFNGRRLEEGGLADAVQFQDANAVQLQDAGDSTPMPSAPVEVTATVEDAPADDGPRTRNRPKQSQERLADAAEALDAAFLKFGRGFLAAYNTAEPTPAAMEVRTFLEDSAEEWSGVYQVAVGSSVARPKFLDGWNADEKRVEISTNRVPRS